MLQDGIEYPYQLAACCDDSLLALERILLSGGEILIYLAKAKVDYLLAGKLFCGHCGSTMDGECGKSMTGTTHNFYTCYNRMRSRGCDKKPLRKEWIEMVVAQNAKALLNDETIKELADMAIAQTDQDLKENTRIPELTERKKEVDSSIKNITKRKKYSTTNRDGYREYKSNPQVCCSCPTRHLCTKNKDCIKTVTRHIWSNYVEMAEEARHTPICKRMYKARKETIERVFADAKEQHGMRYTRYTGLAQVRNWVKLKFAAMNLKKFAKWSWRDAHANYVFSIICFVFPQYAANPCLA